MDAGRRMCCPLKSAALQPRPPCAERAPEVGRGLRAAPAGVRYYGGTLEGGLSCAQHLVRVDACCPISRLQGPAGISSPRRRQVVRARASAAAAAVRAARARPPPVFSDGEARRARGDAGRRDGGRMSQAPLGARSATGRRPHEEVAPGVGAAVADGPWRARGTGPGREQRGSAQGGWPPEERQSAGKLGRAPPAPCGFGRAALGDEHRDGAVLASRAPGARAQRRAAPRGATRRPHSRRPRSASAAARGTRPRSTAHDKRGRARRPGTLRSPWRSLCAQGTAGRVRPHRRDRAGRRWRRWRRWRVARPRCCRNRGRTRPAVPCAQRDLLRGPELPGRQHRRAVVLQWNAAASRAAALNAVAKAAGVKQASVAALAAGRADACATTAALVRPRPPASIWPSERRPGRDRGRSRSIAPLPPALASGGPGAV